MKHTWKITFILLGMFFITQLIGLAVVNSYTNIPLEERPSMFPQEEVEPAVGLFSMLIAFVIAIVLILMLNKYRVKFVLRAWFFLVIIIALTVTLYGILFYIPFFNGLASKIVQFGSWQAFSMLELLAAAIAIIPAYFKIFKQNLLVHNITELMVYPGIGAVFVSFFYYSLNPGASLFAVVLLLVIFSIYDIWAVNHSGIMQKMAKFQINELKLFAGFFVPYMDEKQRAKIKEIKMKYKKKDQEKAFKDKRVKVSLAILGGGDVVFPIIAAGAVLKILGLIPALFVVVCATIALLFLFTTARKGKFYPALPFLSGGIFIGMILGLLLTLI
jgi:presenilin-like A22 family membrane protease